MLRTIFTTLLFLAPPPSPTLSDTKSRPVEENVSDLSLKIRANIGATFPYSFFL